MDMQITVDNYIKLLTATVPVATVSNTWFRKCRARFVSYSWPFQLFLYWPRA